MSDSIYLGDYDNTVSFQLKLNDAGVDLSSATQIEALIAGILVTSVNGANDLIRWDQAGYLTGEVRAKLGSLTGLAPGSHPCNFIIYTPDYPDGLVFDAVGIPVKELYMTGAP